MSDISAISNAHKLSSKKMVSIETPKEPQQVSASEQTQKMDKLEDQMKQIERGFTLVAEIRHSLEAALKNL